MRSSHSLPGKLIVALAIAFLAITVAAAQSLDALPANHPDPCQAHEPGIDAAIAAANSPACLELMASTHEPDFERVPLDSFSLHAYSFWHAKSGADIFASPGGQQTGAMPAGFNYVRAADTSAPGWIQRADGGWLKREDVQLAQPSTLRGMILPQDWQRPFAMILDKTGIYASLTPGGKRSPESGYVTRRYELVNIFARAEDADDNVWYLIGPRRWLRQEFVAKFAPVARPEGVTGRWMAVDLFEQSLIAYEDDTPVFATVVSSGMRDWSTPEGTRRIWARLAADSMTGSLGAPEAYALEQVPWVMYFAGDISLHGAYWHDDFGYRRSHGCVNLSVSDARWLYHWTGEIPPGEQGNAVFVYSTGIYRNG